MKKTILLVGVLTLCMASAVIGQVVMPRESNRQEIAQTVGDAKISIVYHRPNAKGRKIWDCETKDFLQKGGVTYPCMAPNNQVWRSGANENTTIEFSTDVSINGQALPAGKYGFHTIPNKKEWVLIFSKINNEWGSFTYKADQDALRVNVMPVKTKTNRETLMYEFETVSGATTKVVLSWEKLLIPFTVNVGDVNGRVLKQIREAIKNAKADDMRPLNQGANFVLSNKMSAAYDEALGWLNKSVSIRETFGNLSAKARLLAEMGKKDDAIAAGEKAVTVGKAATPPANTADFEKTLAEWKTKK